MRARTGFLKSEPDIPFLTCTWGTALMSILLLMSWSFPTRSTMRWYCFAPPNVTKLLNMDAPARDSAPVRRRDRWSEDRCDDDAWPGCEPEGVPCGWLRDGEVGAC